jgi:hypothetical protein
MAKRPTPASVRTGGQIANFIALFRRGLDLETLAQLLCRAARVSDFPRWL